MGGGKKNKSITKMTKTKAPKEPKQKEKTDIQASSKKNLGIVMPDVNSKKVVAELKGLKVLTPSVVATKYNIRVSLAKAFLKELEKRKMVEYISGGKNLKIYKAVVE